jgi:hypothetical protein
MSRPPTVSNSFKSRQVQITDLSATNLSLSNLKGAITPGTTLTASVSSLVIKINNTVFRIPLLSAE